MGPEGRRTAFEEGGLRRDELTAWAARYPEEIPLVNGELPWIAATLADLRDQPANPHRPEGGHR